MANILRKIAIQVDFQRGGKVYWNMFKLDFETMVL